MLAQTQTQIGHASRAVGVSFTGGLVSIHAKQVLKSC